MARSGLSDPTELSSVPITHPEWGSEVLGVRSEPSFGLGVVGSRGGVTPRSPAPRGAYDELSREQQVRMPADWDTAIQRNFEVLHLKELLAVC